MATSLQPVESRRNRWEVEGVEFSWLSSKVSCEPCNVVGTAQWRLVRWEYTSLYSDVSTLALLSESNVPPSQGQGGWQEQQQIS